jgi:hypothetical protein
LQQCVDNANKQDTSSTAEFGFFFLFLAFCGNLRSEKNPVFEDASDASESSHEEEALQPAIHAAGVGDEKTELL